MATGSTPLTRLRDALTTPPASPQWRRVEHGVVVVVGSVLAARLLVALATREGRSALVRGVVGRLLAAARAVPGVAGAIETALEGALAPMMDELAPRDPSALDAVPVDGMPPGDVQALVLQRLGRDAEESGLRRGANFAGIYHELDTPLTALQGALLAACVNTNSLYPGVFKSGRAMEAETVAMAVGMLKGHARIALRRPPGAPPVAAPATPDPAPDACGLLTTGGTESVLIAVKAYRDAARAARGWTLGDDAAPLEIIAGVTAHPALDKACHYFDVKLVKLEVDAVTQRLDPAAVAAAATPATIAIYASAPTFPHGVVDPIPELAALAHRLGYVPMFVSLRLCVRVTRCGGGFGGHCCLTAATRHPRNTTPTAPLPPPPRCRVGLHVDNCLGGVLMSYARAVQQAGGEVAGVAAIPPFDFSASPGVTTISMDLHKFGGMPKGASIVAFRSPALRAYAYTTVSSWPGGLYATPSMVGSRSAAPAVVCWATLRAMGSDGLATAAAATHALHTRLCTAVAAVPGLRLLGAPTTAIVAFTTAPGAAFSIYSLVARMEARGWHLTSLQRPAGAHFCVSERFAAVFDAWVADLTACAAAAAAEPHDPRYEGKGTAGIYGAATVLPPGEVDGILTRYCDILTMVRK